ncbi:BRO1-like domain-containing protein [Cantharellus anzutake]|uniref:BRO1-like domain-containing protein n=1 Tax=Cantharellus anzutake TaxID=1750568 RepID=UPI001908517C|nr:BRO1-like domain-containing protein [Cantharellus anzutake]KAF8336855.1 BRO1-like domain-containing protein [Cantharellus anzutake]
MPQSPMIWIPRKKTEEVDWTTPVRTVITNSYGESPDSYAAECAQLQRFRQDAVRGAGSDLTARDLLYKYFGQLEFLELRFSEIKVPFPWQDAFTNKLTTQTSLAFEKASIIFQMGATHSTIAAAQMRSDPEGQKRAFHYFRCAAGMLTYINENFLHAPSTDMSKEVVKYLVGIMMAQATEIFLERVINEKKGNALISKVASQTASLYAGLTEEVKDFYGKGIIDRNWVNLIQIKATYFSALTHYHRHLVDDAASKHGDALSRIQLAESQAKEAHKTCVSAFTPYYLSMSTQSSGSMFMDIKWSSYPTLPPDASSALTEIAQALSILTSSTLKEYSRTNDLIYNAVPTPAANLPAVEKLVVARPISIQELYNGSTAGAAPSSKQGPSAAAPSPSEMQRVIGPDLFARLIPMAVHRSASIYSEEKAKVVRAEAERSEIADAAASEALGKLGLPGDLNRWKEIIDAEEGGSEDDDGIASGFPQELKVWGDDIRRVGGLAGFKKSLRGLEDLRAKTAEELDATRNELDEESRECEIMRVKYEHEFTQAPSAPLTRELRADFKTRSETFTAAAASDSQITSLLSEFEDDIDLLQKGVPSLLAVWKQATGSNEPQPGLDSLLDLDEGGMGGQGEKEKVLNEIKSSVREIGEKLGTLNKIKRERGVVLKDLKERVQNDDVSHVLILHSRSPNPSAIEPTIFANELEKFRPYQAKLTTLIQQQEALLDETAALWKALTKGKGRSWVKGAEEKEKKKAEVLGRFATAYDAWLTISHGLEKGTQYYKQLGELVSELYQKIREFVRPRTRERETIVARIETKRRLKSPPPSSSAPPLVPEKPRVPPPPGPAGQAPILSGLSSSFSGLGLSSPAPPRPPASAPERRQNIPTTSTYSSPPQAHYTSPILPPPPTPYNQPNASPPSLDPYADLFNTPGISSAFSLNTSSNSQQLFIPPPPLPPTSHSSPPSQQTSGYYSGSYPAFPPPPSRPPAQYGQYGLPPPLPPPPPSISPPSQYSQYPPPLALQQAQPQLHSNQKEVYSSPGKNPAPTRPTSPPQWYGQDHGQQGYGR